METTLKKGSTVFLAHGNGTPVLATYLWLAKDNASRAAVRLNGRKSMCYVDITKLTNIKKP